MSRPNLMLEIRCPICDPDASSVERTTHWIRDGDLWCVNAVAHLELSGGADDQLLVANISARAYRTDGDSHRYHLQRRCSLLVAGQRARTHPAPVFETSRLEALRSGRTACHGCCPTEWDSQALDRAVAATDGW